MRDAPPGGRRPAGARGEDGGEDVDGSPRSRAEELAGVGTWSLDLVTGRLTTNQAARALLGRTPADPPPTLQDFLVRVHPDDAARLRVVTDRLLRHGEEYVLEHRALLDDGRVLHLRASACAERDEAGRVVAAHGVTLDVTALRQAAQEAARERDRSRAVLSSLSEGYLLSSGGVVVEVNEALCAMTGFSADELLGSSAPYPFWPPDQAEELLALRTALQAAGGGRGDHEGVRKDGTRFSVALTATALDGAGGEDLWVVLLRDTTGQRLHQRELERRAATDPLTGVLNSRAFREALRAEVRDVADGRPLSLALVDVDHFKAVNDRHGHAVGDEVLVAVVERLVEATRGRAVVARVGGEEFALLMTATDLEAARCTVGDALQALRSAPLPTVGTVTASAGVAQLVPGMDDDALYRVADALLYEAKDAGRDRVR